MWWKILKSFSKIFWKTLANHLQAILTLICIEGIATTKTKTNPQGISMHVDFVWQYYKLKKIVSSSSLLLSGCNTSCFSHGSILCFSCLTSSKISWGLGWGKMLFCMLSGQTWVMQCHIGKTQTTIDNIWAHTTCHMLRIRARSKA